MPIPKVILLNINDLLNFLCFWANIKHKLYQHKIGINAYEVFYFLIIKMLEDRSRNNG